jgi:hypothetical protein
VEAGDKRIFNKVFRTRARRSGIVRVAVARSFRLAATTGC